MSENVSVPGETTPNWSLLFSDSIEIASAQESWRVVTIELRERDLLTDTNRPLILRLVSAYVLYERELRHVAEHGAVIQPKRGNTKAIARVNPHFTTMSKLSIEASTLEGLLGISPRSRGKVTPAARKASRTRAADRYLKVVK
jgi:P27 family predicted phage terminase small subunit